MDEKRLNILSIDDDESYVSVIKHYLRPFQNHRFDLILANNAEKAFEIIHSNPNIDLILLDYFLPATNGLEVAKQLSKEQNTIPIILLTSNKDFHIAIEAMKYGVEEYLVKEETIDTMLPRTILNVLERVQLNRKISSIEKEKLLTKRKTEAIQELIVTMCHEFNNPLAAIKISTDILVRQDISPSDRALLTELNKNITLLEHQIIKLRDLNVAGK
jgi:DNA-binding NtrC family response regulator